MREYWTFLKATGGGALFLFGTFFSTLLLLKRVGVPIGEPFDQEAWLGASSAA